MRLVKTTHKNDVNKEAPCTLKDVNVCIHNGKTIEFCSSNLMNEDRRYQAQ